MDTRVTGAESARPRVQDEEDESGVRSNARNFQSSAPSVTTHHALSPAAVASPRRLSALAHTLLAHLVHDVCCAFPVLAHTSRAYVS
eukprot:6196241-Pleurochrysis_carterae.AAC.1